MNLAADRMEKGQENDGKQGGPSDLSSSCLGDEGQVSTVSQRAGCLSLGRGSVHSTEPAAKHRQVWVENLTDVRKQVVIHPQKMYS